MPTLVNFTPEILQNVLAAAIAADGPLDPANLSIQLVQSDAPEKRSLTVDDFDLDPDSAAVALGALPFPVYRPDDSSMTYSLVKTLTANSIAANTGRFYTGLVVKTTEGDNVLAYVPFKENLQLDDLNTAAGGVLTLKISSTGFAFAFDIIGDE